VKEEDVMRVKKWLIAAIATASFGFASAQAAKLVVKVENLASTGSLNLSPLFVAFHNGSFDTFNAGAAALPGLQPLAESGNATGLAARLSTTDPGATWGLIPVPGPSGLAQIEPGESGSMIFTVDGSLNHYFSYGAMVVPSNDAFTSNDNPLAFQLFGAGGGFLGNKSILLTGSDVWDAGTEVNGLFGSAFIVGQNAALHTDEGGVVMHHPGFGVFDDQLMPNGQTFNAANANVVAGRDFWLARITISEVPELGSIFLAFGALGLATFLLRRRTAAV
jgi:hypothetical protein